MSENLYLNPSLPVEKRVEDLLKRMTLKEKIAQLCSIPASVLFEGGHFSIEKARSILVNGIGQITRLAGDHRLRLKPREVAEAANVIQRFLLEETRLHIPAIIHEECLSGFMAWGATTFPQAIGLASTWNPDLVEKVASTIRRQMRAVGAHQGLAPVLDVARDPRWGRVEETYGEEPYLIASMGVSYVRGLQGDEWRSRILATPKHFAAHGFPEGGRNCAPVHIGVRGLREVFLLPFEAAVREAGALSIMSAYHDIDGVPCTASKTLLTDILRGEWGFQGIVVSDYGAIHMLHSFHMIASNLREAAVKALEAGVDIELPAAQCYWEPLLEALKNGVISETVVDRAVSRVLRVKFLLGLFENPYVDVEEASRVFDTIQDRGLTLQAARESIVLLKNDGVLPLSRTVDALAVIGPNAAEARNLLGDYSYTAHLSLEKPAVEIVSILEGIKAKVSPETKVYYAQGCGVSDYLKDGFKEALDIAGKSNVIIAVMGERSGLSKFDVSGEGRDRDDTGLPGVQEELLEALCGLGKPVVLVLVNGRPLALSRIVEKCAAVIEAWLPGEEGGNAVADVLFGDYNPSGRLPVTFPRSSGQIPVYSAMKPSSIRNYVFTEVKPLFPFGHGLSYTEFEYSLLNISPERVEPDGEVSVSCTVKNVGGLKGDEVVQVYVRDEYASVARPVRELKGFKKISLEPGEERRITFIISTDQLAFYDHQMKFVVEPGFFKVMIGRSSEDIRLAGRFEVVGWREVFVSSRKLFSSVIVE
ncbi:glycoside hydrolase family 3 C-terminal domain-containing protein [Candidatus Bathyarchaeota archaeon]|nr:glycoside hydrolase family 3 C-terminal domain-containing protein [Candidatus Bathyarchaeota archaeon]